MIAAWYDAAHPGLFLSGFGQVFPPGTLLALLNADSTIEIWTAGQTSRIAGPVPFGMIADVSGNVFASAALAKAYLDQQFSAIQNASAFVDGGII